MTDEEILEAAIEKAIESGWEYDIGVGGNADHCVPEYLSNKSVWLFNEFGDQDSIDTHRLIFSHDFAKAFWPLRTYKESVRPGAAGSPRRPAASC